jgi:group I intron endonuclease
MNFQIELIDLEDGKINQLQMIVIYKITSPTGKIYIGQTRNWTSRKSKYKNLKNFQQLKIHRSILKYGYDSHHFEVIHKFLNDVSQEIINYYEIFYWEKYKNEGFEMLNIRYPGSNGKLSEDTKLKMSISRSGEKNSMYGKYGKDHPAYGKIGYWKGKFKDQHPRYGICGEKHPHYGRSGEKHPMFGKTKGDSPFAKKVINVLTNEVYPSAKDAAEIMKINYSSLKSRLRKNRDSELRYL